MAYVIKFSDGTGEFQVSAPTRRAALRLAKSLRKAEASSVSVTTRSGELVYVDGADLPAQDSGDR